MKLYGVGPVDNMTYDTWCTAAWNIIETGQITV